MLLIQIGNLTLNLRYLILAEDSRGQPEPLTVATGSIRVTIEDGRVIEFTGACAEELRRRLAELVPRRQGGSPMADRPLRTEELSPDPDPNPDPDLDDGPPPADNPQSSDPALAFPGRQIKQSDLIRGDGIGHDDHA